MFLSRTSCLLKLVKMLVCLSVPFGNGLVEINETSENPVVNTMLSSDALRYL